MPFWHGDKPGRPIELGRAVGAFTRTLRGARRDAALERLRRDVGLDELASSNLVSYLEEQMEATGAVPDDRTVVVERFRDEIGDWRMCVLSPFGSRVHAPWAMAIEGRMLERFGPGAQVLWSDDGIVVRLPEAVDRIPAEDLLFDPDGIEQAVVEALPQTAMFASVFREAAARALLLPRRRPGQRTPLWQQRQRSADLLAEASKFPDFPILLEATRECLRDVFDVPALREVMADLRSRRTASGRRRHRARVAVRAIAPVPVGRVYMYEGDAPLAERRAAALTLDRDLLRELLGSEELRELLDPRALDEVELELQRLDDGRGREVGGSSARPASHAGRAHGRRDRGTGRGTGRRRLHGPTARGRPGDPHPHRRRGADRRDRRRRPAPRRARRVTPHRVARRVHGRDRPAARGSRARYARTHGPFLPSEVAARLGASTERVADALASLEAADHVVRGEFRPGGSGREWCDPDVLRRLRRRSLALLRREVEPVDAAALGRFLPAWQGADRPRGTSTRSPTPSPGSRGHPCPHRSSRPTCSPRGSAATGPPTSMPSWPAATSPGSAPDRSAPMTGG